MPTELQIWTAYGLWAALLVGGSFCIVFGLYRIRDRHHVFGACLIALGLASWGPPIYYRDTVLTFIYDDEMRMGG